jgi:hypothetical protein
LKSKFKVHIDPHAPLGGFPVRVGYKGTVSDWELCGYSDMTFPDGVKISGRMWWSNYKTGKQLPYRGSLRRSIVLHYLYRVISFGFRS